MILCLHHQQKERNKPMKKKTAKKRTTPTRRKPAPRTKPRMYVLPKTAAELRQRLAASGVAPWDDDKSRQWWREHRHVFDGDAATRIDRPRTIGIDAHTRALPTPSGSLGTRASN